jgi:hypothetical protein
MTSLPARPTALLTVLGILAAGCGSSAGSSVLGATGSSTATTRAVQRVTHANPVTLLPTASQAAQLIRPSASPSRYDQTLSSSTLSSAFASEVPRATKEASGTAELDVVGHHGSFLYAHVFVFKTLAGAQSLTSAFLNSTRLGSTLSRPAGAPGQAAVASSQPYGGRREISYRYAFRDGNVLAYVELDGPRHRYSAAQAGSLARIVDQQIRAAAGG